MALRELTEPAKEGSTQVTANAFGLQEGSGSWLLPLPVRVPSMARQWSLWLSARLGSQLGEFSNAGEGGWAGSARP